MLMTMDTQGLEDNESGSELALGTVMTSNPYLQYTWVQLHDALIEKEYQLQCATDELCKLSLTEAESNRKDGVIADLRKELAAHRKNSSGKDISYVSMEEHLASCEGHLQEKTEEVVKLRKEISEVHQQMQSTATLCASLKKQLASKSSAVSSQTEDIQKLHQQLAAATELTASLRKEGKDKQRSITSLQEKVKRLQQTNQDLQKRLEDSQAGEGKLTASESRTKTELTKLKGDVTAMKRLQARCDFLEAEVSKAKERENSLACELGSKSDELSTLCQKLLAVTSQRSSRNSPDDALGAVSRLVNEQAHTAEQLLELDGKLKEAQQNISAVCEDVEGLKQCFSNFKDSNSSLDISPTLESAITSLRNLQCGSQLNELKVLDQLQESVSSCLQSLQARMEEDVTNWAQISQKLALGCKSLEEGKGESDPFEMVSFIVEMAQSKTRICQQVNEKLSQSELEHRAALSGAVAAIKQDGEARLAVEIERVKQAEQERCMSQLKEVQQHLEEEKNTAIAHEQENTKVLMEELEHSKKLLVDAQTEVQEKKDFERKVVSLEDQLKEMAESHSQAMCVAEEQRATVRQQLQDEVSSYKEQSQQYALTIVALEEKLLVLMEKCQALEDVNKEQFGRSADSSTVEPTKDTTERMQKLVGVLRHQLTLASKDGQNKQAQIHQLKQALQLARTNLLDQESTLKEQHSAEVQDLKKTLAVQEDIIESQKQEVAHLKRLLQIETEKPASEEPEHGHVQEELQTEAPTATEENKTGKDLMLAGGRCLGNRHDEVISNQREAIVKLREELNIAMLANPPAPTHQATLKELSKVRGELLTARTQQNAHEGKVERGGEGSDDNDLPGTSLRPCDLMEILHSSEQLYDSLVDIVCERLSIQKPTSGSMIIQDKAMYKQVFHNRQKFCDKVAVLMRTDSQSEHSQSKPHQPNDSPDDSHSSQCSEESVSGTEAKKVIAELETELSVTAEALDQQQRLNQALIRRQKFREIQSNEASNRVSHSCFNKTQD